MNLTGRTAVITGGGRGVGAAAAYALAEAGATVAVAARNEEQVVDVAAQLRQRGYEAFAFRCDVTDHHQVRDLALSASETMGKVDILINNAGTGVTVNAVCPGYVDTSLTDETVARRMQRTGQLWQEAMDSILEESGQPRLIRAEDVAEVIMPLLSEDASETNGQLVVIDGKDSP